MIIELLGQPASGKSFIAKELEFYLTSQGFTVYNAEARWKKKSKVNRVISLFFFYITNLLIFTNRNFKTCQNEINSYRSKSKKFYKRQLYIYLYWIYSSLKAQNDIVILSEGIINLSAYIYRLNITEQKINLFYNLLLVAAKKRKLRFLNVKVDFEDIFNSKIKRLEKENVSFKRQFIIEDVKENIMIFDKLSKFSQFNDKIITFYNTFESINQTYLEFLMKQILI